MIFEEVSSYEKGFRATIHSRKTGFELLNFLKNYSPSSFFEKKSHIFDFWVARLIVSVSFLIDFDFWCLGRIVLLRLGRNGAIFSVAEVIARPVSHKQAILGTLLPK